MIDVLAIFCYDNDMFPRLFQRLFMLLMFVLLVSILPPVFAQDKPDGTLKLVPAYQEVTLDQPDQTKDIQLIFTNNSTHQITLKMSALDFKQKEPAGITSFIGQEDKNYSYSLASFLSLPSDTLVLEAGEKKSYKVQITNRKDVSPGGHYAAVVARLVAEAPADKTTHLSPAISSLIYLRKTGGEKFSLLLKDVDWPDNRVIFTYESFMKLIFQNEGNVHVVPYGLVQITDVLNTVLYEGTINTSSARILPETRRDIDVSLQLIHRSWPISLNTMTIKGHDSLGKVTYAFKRRFIYINPAVLILLAAGLYIVISYKRKQKH